MTVSQQFSHTSLRGENDSLTLKCTTNDFNDTIIFQLDASDKGGCLSGVDGFCRTTINGYNNPKRKGTNITEMTITACNTTRDTGNWTCSYGGLTSSVITISACRGVTTEGPTTIQHDVTVERIITTTNDSTTTMQNTDTICSTTICISIAALLLLILLFIIASLIALLCLCCTGRLTCILPHAFLRKNTSKSSTLNSKDKHENRQSYKTDSENEYRIYKGDERTTSYQLKPDNKLRNKSYSVDENGHQSKNKHVVKSDSSQSKRNYLPSTEYNIKNTKNPNTRDNRHVHNRGYYETNW